VPSRTASFHSMVGWNVTNKSSRHFTDRHYGSTQFGVRQSVARKAIEARPDGGELPRVVILNAGTHGDLTRLNEFENIE